MCVRRIENFLQASEKFCSLQNRGKIKVRVRNSQPDFERDFFKIPTFLTFPSIESDWRVVQSWFFYERKELIKADLPDTQNMCLGRIENFLQASEKSFTSKTKS